MFTPFFPSLRARLSACGRRTVESLRRLNFEPLADQLRALLPPELLASEDEGANSRDRIYSLRVTFAAFIWQMLKPKTACREVVRAVQALYQPAAKSSVDDGTSAYIQARQRLPRERLEKALLATAATAERRVPGQGQIHGRTVIVVDCSTTQLPDTQKNQARYSQPSGQKKGCGFPLIKFLALSQLGSGAMLRVLMDDWKTHDLRLLRRAWEHLPKRAILLGDRAYADYATLACLPRQEVDVVARLSRTRKVDFRRAKQRLGKQDALFEWRKGYQQSEILTTGEWRDMPDKITVRVLRFEAMVRGRKQRITLVTTLLDPVAYPAQELIALYARRWNLELSLRHLKTTLGMEQLRCQTPDMAEKELLAYFLAYNLMRCLMAEAVSAAGVEMERLSFKGTVDSLRQYTAAIGRARSKKKRQALWDDLVRQLCHDLVPHRPGRREPRAVKRRPKPYPLLTRPRHQYKEMRHRSRYRKNGQTKTRALI
jgi:hypothetical protein